MTKISSTVVPNCETVFGSASSPSLSHWPMFLPTMPGIMIARPMQTALTYGAPMASTLKMWSSVREAAADGQVGHALALGGQLLAQLVGHACR